MKQYFITTISYSALQENGVAKKIKESYLVDAMSFSEAETRTIEYAREYISGEFIIKAIKPVNYAEIVAKEGCSGDYYRIKVYFITLDEKTGSERRSANYILVLAVSPEDAITNINNAMKSSLADYQIDTIALTNITKVLYHDKKGV